MSNWFYINQLKTTIFNSFQKLLRMASKATAQSNGLLQPSTIPNQASTRNNYYARRMFAVVRG